MTHMAAISLFIDNWRTDTHDLREDLRFENKQSVHQASIGTDDCAHMPQNVAIL